jgi:nicotinamidase-related amidase
VKPVSQSSNQAAPDLTQFYAETGLAGRVGFGANPAVVVIDMQVGWNDPARRLGADMTPAIEACEELLAAARAKEVPAVYVWSCWDDEDAGYWQSKIPALSELTPDSDGVAIHPRVAPRPGDAIVLKKGPSGFFKTPLAEVLAEARVDTVLLVGASTSGCVRATAIDSLSHGYRTILPAEAVGDRAEAPHLANLLDIDAKYGDVVELAEVLDYLNGLPADVEERRAASGAPRPVAMGSRKTWPAAPATSHSA